MVGLQVMAVPTGLKKASPRSRSSSNKQLLLLSLARINDIYYRGLALIDYANLLDGAVTKT
jgi:hypothetical protein